MKAFLLAILLFCCASADDRRSINVSTVNGIVTGFQVSVRGWDSHHSHVWQFLGIPFAEPPIGELRFRRPQPLTSIRHQPLIADKQSKGCLQVQGLSPFQWSEEDAPKYGEDCLYLHIWTPPTLGGIETTTGKTVMVWIHGGGFVGGEGLPLYNGKTLAVLADVVVVTIQYRLGFPGFARFDKDLVPGNNGLFDQQMALRWIHENIRNFGGNPESITIFGQSAGSASVSYHLLNAESSKYFQRAILHSGVATNPWGHNYNTDALEVKNREIAAEYLKCHQVDTHDLLKCLQGKSEAEMSETVQNYTMTHMNGPHHGPTIDGEFLATSAHEMVSRRDIQPKDVIMGVTEQEGALFTFMMSLFYAGSMNITNMTTSHMTEGFVNFTTDMMFGHYYPSYPYRPSSITKEIIRTMAKSQVDPSRGDLNAVKLSQVVGINTIDCAVNVFADAMRSIHDRVYFYQMAHKPSTPFLSGFSAEWSKCTHGDEIPYIFASHRTLEMFKDHMTEEENQLSLRMIGDFSYFAKTGRPIDPNWMPYTLKAKEYYRYGIRSSLETGGISRDECVFWHDILPSINSVVCQRNDEKCIDSPNDQSKPSSAKQRSTDEL